MATQAVAGVNDKVLSAALPGILREVGLGVYSSHAFWSVIDGAGMKKDWEGESMQGAVVTNTYGKAASYQNDDAVDTSHQEPWKAFQYELGGYQVSVNISGMKLRKVKSSPQKLFDLVKGESELAILDMVDLMSTHVFQTTNDAKGIYSLYTMTDATTTIAGLAGSSQWGGTTTTSGSFAGQGLNDLMTLFTTLSGYTSLGSKDKTGFSDQPDFNVTTLAVWQYYWNALQTGMRYSPGGAGDINLKMAFMGNPVITDSHVVAGVWHMFQKSALSIRVMPDADFTLLPPATSTTQPDTYSRAAIWNGQLVVVSRRPLGKLISLAA